MDFANSKLVLCTILTFILSGIGHVQAQPPFDYIKPFTISREISRDTSPQMLETVIRHYLNLKKYNLPDGKIKTVNYIGTYQLKGMEPDSALVFSFEINENDLPMTYRPFKRIFIVNNNSHKCYIVNLDSAEPIKTDKSSGGAYFAGRFKNRNRYGYFKVYEFRQGVLTQIFQSPDYISNYSLDCISYEDDDLLLENSDVNEDGYLDLQFSGIKNYYCRSGETMSRLDCAPIKREKIRITYLYDQKHATWQKE